MVCSLAMAGCSKFISSSIEVRSGAASPITDIRAEIGGRQIRLADIAPGESVKANFEATADSAAILHYRLSIGGPIVECRGDVYVTVGMRVQVVATIGPDGRCTVVER
jgi:hypothetical protein